MLIVVALGGNALQRRGEAYSIARQRRNARCAARVIAGLAGRHAVVVTHGNGPQVGMLALQAAALAHATPTPLDVLGAESEGMIGYLIEQELANAAPRLRVATLLTRVEVRADDPAFRAPTKPIGPIYEAREGRRLARVRSWRLARDGAGLRRVVASPEPRRILEIAAVRALIEAGFVVVCAGGGGIPVVRTATGFRGVEAVIDKDLAAALLARALGADRLLLLTDVDAVYADFGTAHARAIRRTNPAALRRRRFAAGSMGPKVEAACRFVGRSRRRAIIGALAQASTLLGGNAGTEVRAHAREVLDQRSR